MPGDFYGLIGLNGSGKSTLLKVISGVYKPSAGKVTVNGTIAPLIELGAGFDMDLTARENIYLNGIMSKLTSERAKNSSNRTPPCKRATKYSFRLSCFSFARLKRIETWSMEIIGCCFCSLILQPPYIYRTNLSWFFLNTYTLIPRLSAEHRKGISTMFRVRPVPHITQERTAVMYQ